MSSAVNSEPESDPINTVTMNPVKQMFDPIASRSKSQANLIDIKETSLCDLTGSLTESLVSNTINSAQERSLNQEEDLNILTNLTVSTFWSLSPALSTLPWPLVIKNQADATSREQLSSRSRSSEQIKIKTESELVIKTGTKRKLINIHPSGEVPLIGYIKKEEHEYTEEVSRDNNYPRNLSVMSKFQPPNIITRIMFVVNLFLDPQMKVTILDTPPELVNQWGEELTKIKKKFIMKRGTSSDREFFSAFSGFYHLMAMSSLTRHLQSRSFWANYTVEEVQKFIPKLSKQEKYCPSCHILHLRPPFQCASARGHGPRILQHLELNSEWRVDIQAIVIGVQDFLYLPPALRKIVLNLGEFTPAYYNVPHYSSESTIVDTSPSSLYARIIKAIELIGFSSTLPIILEFYPSANLHLPIIWHIIGFLSTVRRAQQRYNGPLIVLISGITPMPNMSSSFYNEKKLEFKKVEYGIYAAGLAIGVPIAIPPIQSADHPESQVNIRFDFWDEEPLYSRSGIRTREYHGRLTYYIKHLIKFYKEAENRLKTIVV